MTTLQFFATGIDNAAKAENTAKEFRSLLQETFGREFSAVVADPKNKPGSRMTRFTFDGTFSQDELDVIGSLGRNGWDGRIQYLAVKPHKSRTK